MPQVIKWNWERHKYVLRKVWELFQGENFEHSRAVEVRIGRFKNKTSRTFTFPPIFLGANRSLRRDAFDKIRIQIRWGY